MKNTSLHLLLALLLIAIPLQFAQANTPCSGNKGGIAHCDGSKFVCKDGSYSASTKDCSVVFSGSGTTTSNTQPVTNTDLTEKIVECYRDISELLVIGGVIWGNNPADDYFVQSHGVKTPDAYWKVIIRGTGQDERAIAWIVPNTQEATMKKLDQYLVTVDEIEKVTGETIPVADYAKHDKPSQSWLIPAGCNKG